MTTIPRSLQMPKRTTQRFNFALIGVFLTFEMLEHFLDILHVVERFPQCGHDVVYLLERFPD
jgi:hypothetical protein